MFRKIIVSIPALIAAVLLSTPAHALTPEEVLADFKNEAKQESPAFQEFSATRGEQFFKQKHGQEWSCSSCHTNNPAATGKHAKTDKPIEPLAPAANPERFTNNKKIAKWFKRNCNDVLDRVCTSQEKGDVLTYLLTIKK